MRLVVAVFLVVGIAALGTYSFGLNDSQIQSAQVLAAQTTRQTNPYLTEINSIRQDSGLNALQLSETNQSIAEVRAREIVTTQSYSHTRPSGGIFSDMYSELPEQSCENLQLQDSDSIDKAIEAWLGSPGHSECMLEDRSRVAGLAISKLFPNSEESHYVFVYIGSSN